MHKVMFGFHLWMIQGPADAISDGQSCRADASSSLFAARVLVIWNSVTAEIGVTTTIVAFEIKRNIIGIDIRKE